MFSELHQKNNPFRQKYLPHLISRFTNASLEMESESGNFASPYQALKIWYQTQAIEYALDQDPGMRLNLGDIKEIEKLVTCEELENFRTTRAEVAGSKVLRTPANMIYNALYNLLNSYYNIWCDADPFWREANFHIQFLYIHPFQDGNGRTARVLLFRNLCANGQIPCVITKEVKAEYCSYIENNDVEGLANLFRRLSENELTTMLNIYNFLNDRKLIPDNLMSQEQEKIYCAQTDRLFEPTENNGMPLRNLANLISIFKYSLLPKDAKEDLKITGLQNFEHFLDENSNDFAVYCEKTRTLSIGIKGDMRFFVIRQIGNGFSFTIDGQECLPAEFEYELKTAGLEDGKVRVFK